MGNMFTSTEEWYEDNEDLAAGFLELWETRDCGMGRAPG